MTLVAGPRGRALTGRVHVLRVDASLGRGLGPSEFADARGRAVAQTLTLMPGNWEPTWDPELWSDCLGLHLVSGTLLQRVVVAGRVSAEFVGVGDVVQPWHAVGLGGLEATSQWKVCEPTVIAMFDRRFQQLCAPWPEIPSAIVERVVERSASLSVRLALAQIPRLSDRLLLLLWHLADRWGKVDRHGVLLPLRLSHQTLADLACAQRSSVSHVIRDLVRAGQLARTEAGFWRLRGHGPSDSGTCARGDLPLSDAGASTHG
jgi:hypothetical protein